MSHSEPFELLEPRAREIFRRLVETYLDEGEPVGSRNLSRQLPHNLSPATIRNVMSDLEEMGLIYAPHISAGRMPTHQGLRLFVDAFLEFGGISEHERRLIEGNLSASGEAANVESVLTEATQMLSGLSQGAGLVLTSKGQEAVKHIEFVRIEPTKALCVIVGQSGAVENRILELPAGVTESQLAEAANFLNSQVRGLTLHEARAQIAEQRAEIKGQLDVLSQRLVEDGLAVWSGADASTPPKLIVRGRSNLIESVSAAEDMERLRLLFDDLESKDDLMQLLDLTEAGAGVRIFIGAETNLFSLSGSSVVVAPFRDGEDRVLGALGVIGPTRLNYAKIVPMVDYTSQLISRLMRS